MMIQSFLTFFSAFPFRLLNPSTVSQSALCYSSQMLSHQRGNLLHILQILASLAFTLDSPFFASFFSVFLSFDKWHESLGFKKKRKWTFLNRLLTHCGKIPYFACIFYISGNQKEKKIEKKNKISKIFMFEFSSQIWNI